MENGHGGEGRDPVVTRALATLDPGAGDPGYWARFRDGVMARAARELARRRRAAEVTIGDVVFGWGRTLVPTALLAAAAAALVLMRADATPLGTPLGVEEMLADGLEGASIPAVLGSEGLPDGGGVYFASETY